VRIMNRSSGKFFDLKFKMKKCTILVETFERSVHFELVEYFIPGAKLLLRNHFQSKKVCFGKNSFWRKC
jgi:hypothetical protein